MTNKPRMWRDLTPEEQAAYKTRNKRVVQPSLPMILTPKEQLQNFTMEQLESGNFEERILG